MKKWNYIVLTLFMFGSISLAQNDYSAEVRLNDYDAFYEDSFQIANPVFPNMGQPEKIGFEMNERVKRGTSRAYFNLFPIADIAASSGVTANENQQINGGVGLGFSTRYTKHFYARLAFTTNYGYEEFNQATSPYLYRPYFYSSSKNKHSFGVQPQLRLSYSPYEFINIQAGIDQHFIGQGNRSMLLSDYSAPHPFVQLRTKIWRIEVSNLYQFLQEKRGGENLNKFASTHFFNYKVTDRLQIGLFESVVFAAKDTLMNRGYELAYLNPFLFYRPTEYGLGSQDRLVIGLNLSYQLNPVLIYGQFVLDEFVLSELMARSRWWANKYGGQIGFKSKWKINNNLPVHWLGELNFARPFIYTHAAVNTVYGNQGRPLAHPLGANFVEAYTEASVMLPFDLTLKAIFFFAQQGGMNSTPNMSYGNDIYIPYTKKPYEHGYYIGGNGKLNRVHFAIEGSYQLAKHLKLSAFIRPMIEAQSLQGENYKAFFQLYLGLRTNLWKDRSFSF